MSTDMHRYFIRPFLCRSRNAPLFFFFTVKMSEGCFERCCRGVYLVFHVAELLRVCLCRRSETRDWWFQVVNDNGHTFNQQANISLWLLLQLSFIYGIKANNNCKRHVGAKEFGDACSLSVLLVSCSNDFTHCVHIISMHQRNRIDSVHCVGVWAGLTCM